MTRSAEELVARPVAGGPAETFVFRAGRLHQRHPAPTGAQTDLLFGSGFCDLQCNGYAGIDFNHPGTTAAMADAAVRAMWRHGCTEVLPTLITAPPDFLEDRFRTLAEMRAPIPGFHLEGPFISPLDGARGAHPRDAVCAIDPALFARWQRAAGGLIRMVTLAPELPGAVEFIRELCAAGVIPALGHTLASAEQIAAASAAGARLATHLGNGCPEHLPRHANPIWAQAAETRLAATLIADGHHLPAPVLRTLAWALGPRAVLVTDAMSAAGAPPGRYPLGGLMLEVGADRVVRLPGAANFAGSALTMDQAVTLFHQITGATWADSWAAASERPGHILGIPAQSLVIARAGTTLEIIATLRGAEVLFGPSSDHA